MRSVVPAISLAASLAIGSAPAVRAAQPSAAAAASDEDPSITLKVRAEYVAWENGSLDFSRYDDAMRKALTPGIVRDVAAQLTAAGEPEAFVFQGKSALPDGSNTVYRYRVETPAVPLFITITYDRSGKISGLYFKPAPQ